MASATGLQRPEGPRPEGPRRRLPGVRTLLLATYLAVLLLPVGGIGFLRLYESALIRQTEAELLAQAAVLSATYRAAWLDRASPEALAAMPAAKFDWGVAPDARLAGALARAAAAARSRRFADPAAGARSGAGRRAPPTRSRSPWPRRWRRCWPTCAR